MSTPEISGPVDVYARQSRKGDKQKSTPGQVAACRAVLAGRGLPAGAVHVDDGKSAWNAKVRRKGWDALMKRLESGAAGGVIVYELSRFSRRPIEGERLIEAAERGMLVLDSESEYDLTGANGKKQFRDMLAGAAYYSDDLSRKVRRGKLEKAMNGNPEDEGRHVDRVRSFGWEADGITVRESEAAWIRWLAGHLLHGDSQDALARHLNARGVLTSRDKPWRVTGLREMLLRERNRGNIEHCGVIVARLPGEPVLDSGTFDRIAAKYAARRAGRPFSRTYLASGHAVCAVCGKPLSTRPVTRRRAYPDGEVAREYWCKKYTQPGRPPGGCGTVRIDQRALDAAARELAIEILADPRHAAQVEAAAARHEEEATALDSLITDAEATALAMADRLGRGEKTLAEYDAVMGPLDKRLTELRAKREALNGGPADPVPAAQSRAGWAARWDAAEPAERRTLLAMALRGRPLIVGPADPSDRRNVTRRITIGDPS